MTPADLDLARRAVACKGWWWMAGMLATSPDYPTGRQYRITVDGHEGRMSGIEDRALWPSPWGYDGLDQMDAAAWLPDLADPATLGCVLALVRADPLWGPCAHVEYLDGWWYCCGIYDAQEGPTIGPFATEAEALITALENAP